MARAWSHVSYYLEIKNFKKKTDARLHNAHDALEVDAFLAYLLDLRHATYEATVWDDHRGTCNTWVTPEILGAPKPTARATTRPFLERRSRWHVATSTSLLPRPPRFPTRLSFLSCRRRPDAPPDLLALPPAAHIPVYRDQAVSLPPSAASRAPPHHTLDAGLPCQHLPPFRILAADSI